MHSCSVSFYLNAENKSPCTQCNNSCLFVERKAKQAEQQIREIARKAREACRRDENTTNSETTPTTPQPPNRQAVLEWYRQQEVLRKAGIDQYNNIEPWFHGNFAIFVMSDLWELHHRFVEIIVIHDAYLDFDPFGMSVFESSIINLYCIGCCGEIYHSMLMSSVGESIISL